MLEDILALPDITADESQKLSELCRIFHSLEGLFFVNLNEVSEYRIFCPFNSCLTDLDSRHQLPLTFRPGLNSHIFRNSWFVFSFHTNRDHSLSLSLQEASIADISYLFEIGALVDFEVDELVSLVRALFADTPLRTSTINKFLGR